MVIDLTRHKSARHFAELKSSIPLARKKYSKRRRLSMDSSYGVGANTLRAFRGVKKPGAIYRRWASAMFKRKEFRKRLLSAVNQLEFERLHRWITDRLNTYWKTKTGKALPIAHRYKLVDLYFKHLVEVDMGNSKLNTNLLKYAHVPIDSAVFAALDGLFSGVLLIKGRSMGNIKSRDAYEFYQRLIAEVMRPLAMSPLHFDYYAWNLPRSKK